MRTFLVVLPTYNERAHLEVAVAGILAHAPARLPDLVAALDHCDLVMGSRYLNGVSGVNWPLHRIMLSACANRYVRFITGLAPRQKGSSKVSRALLLESLRTPWQLLLRGGRLRRR